MDKHSSCGILPEAYSAGLKPATETTVPSWCFFAHEMWLLQRIPLADLWGIPYCGKKEKIVMGRLKMVRKENLGMKVHVAWYRHHIYYH